MIAANAVAAGFAVNPDTVAVPPKVADCPRHTGEVALVPMSGKALRAVREAGEVRGVTDAKGNVLWERLSR